MIPAHAMHTVHQNFPIVYGPVDAAGAEVLDTIMKNPPAPNPSTTTHTPTKTVSPNSDTSHKVWVSKSKISAKSDGSEKPSALRISSPKATKIVNKQIETKAHTSQQTKQPPTPSKRKYIAKDIDSDDENNALLSSKFTNLKSDATKTTVLVTGGDDDQGSLLSILQP